MSETKSMPAEEEIYYLSEFYKVFGDRPENRKQSFHPGGILPDDAVLRYAADEKWSLVSWQVLPQYH